LEPREADSWLFPVRELAQRRLTFDWKTSCDANENAAGTGDPFLGEAVTGGHMCLRGPPLLPYSKP